MKTIFLSCLFFLTVTSVFSNNMTHPSCLDGFITPIDGPDCSYKQQSRKKIFLLASLLPGTGAPYFYGKHWELATPIFAFSLAALTAAFLAKHFNAYRHLNTYFILRYIIPVFIGTPSLIINLIFLREISLFDNNGYALENDL